jgi:hypothetical protein
VNGEQKFVIGVGPWKREFFRGLQFNPYPKIQEEFAFLVCAAELHTLKMRSFLILGWILMATLMYHGIMA